MASIRDTLANLVEQYKQSDVPAAYLLRGDAKGLWKDLNTPKPVDTAQDMTNLALNLVGSIKPVGKTAQELAQTLAQKNAVEMLGLPEGNTAMQRARALGFNVDEPVYHGTTHDFTKFGGKLHNPEGFMGSGHYFTSSPVDASINYARIESPDLSQRIAVKAEQILDANDIYNWSSNSPEYLKAINQAKKEIAGENLGNVIPAFLKSKKTLDVSKQSKDYIDFSPKYDKAGEFVDDNKNVYKLAKILEKQGNKYGFSGKKVLGDLSNEGALMDQVSGRYLNDLLKENERIMYAEHPQTGQLVGNEAIRNIYKGLGYDTITMNPVDEFPKMFENVPGDVKHYIVNNPNQIRSRFAAFDPARTNEPDLLAGAMAIPIATDEDKRNKIIELLKNK
jgi:hypothetical protein